MARPKKYKDPVTLTWKVERSIRDDFQALGRSIDDIMLAGLHTFKPMDVSSCQYRQKQVEVEIEQLKRKHDNDLADLDLSFKKGMEEKENELASLRSQEAKWNEDQLHKPVNWKKRKFGLR
jgi:hypothetical protein